MRAYGVVRIFLSALVFGNLFLVAGAVDAFPKFMTLPFDDPGVILRQGWLYDEDPGPGGRLCQRKSPDYPLCHYGIDYLKPSSGGGFLPFEILAVADGQAIYYPRGSSTWGKYVLTKHTVDGTDYFTVNAHLESSPLPENTWVSVQRGAPLGTAGQSGKANGVTHLHFEVHKDEVITGKGIGNRLDPYNIRADQTKYPPYGSCGADFLWTQCPPVSLVAILQPGPGEGKDIWTTSVFSYAPGGGGPGGGLDNYELVVGGWGDYYYTLLQFDLTGMPTQASSARLELFCFTSRSGITTAMFLDRIVEFWDWKTQGTGPDHERLWWADRPAAVQWIPDVLPPCAIGQWYSISLTDLYNAWQDGTYPNYGVQLRPTPGGDNTWCEFYSSDYLDDPSLRPRLVVVP